MKTKNIFASVLILFTFNVNLFAEGTLNNLLNSIEDNDNQSASFLIKNGRNKHVKNIQNNTVVQYEFLQKNEPIFKKNLPKGRNLEAMNEMITMN